MHQLVASERKGFTLIELLVVISIIGFLTTLAVVSLNSARTKSRDGKRLSDMKQLQTAMELCLNANSGSYEGSYSNCCTVASGGPTLKRVSACTGPNNALDQYIQNISNFKDPSNSTSACASNATATCDYSILAPNANTATTTWVGYFFQEGEYGAGNVGPAGITR